MQLLIFLALAGVISGSAGGAYIQGMDGLILGASSGLVLGVVAWIVTSVICVRSENTVWIGTSPRTTQKLNKRLQRGIRPSLENTMTTSTIEDLPIPTFHDVYLARSILQRYLPPTPLHRYPALDQLLNAQVFVKHENYQPIGAFKIRGGINFMANLPADERARGVVTASTGNHGQSIAYAAQLFGVRAVIVVPQDANPIKVEAMRSYGAEVVFHGSDFEACKMHCSTLEDEEGLRFISSGDEPLLISGVATHTLELLEQQPDIDTIFVPVGGGSGASGTCLVAKAVNPAIQVIGVQATGAPAAQLTWQARQMAHSPHCDLCRWPGDRRAVHAAPAYSLAAPRRLCSSRRRRIPSRSTDPVGEGQDTGGTGRRRPIGCRTSAWPTPPGQKGGVNSQRRQHLAARITPVSRHTYLGRKTQTEVNMPFNYHDRDFPVVSSTAGDLIIADALFQFQQDGPSVWATYSGDAIRFGSLIGAVDEQDKLTFDYHHLDSQGDALDRQRIRCP